MNIWGLTVYLLADIFRVKAGYIHAGNPLYTPEKGVGVDFAYQIAPVFAV